MRLWLGIVVASLFLFAGLSTLLEGDALTKSQQAASPRVMRVTVFGADGEPAVACPVEVRPSFPQSMRYRGSDDFGLDMSDPVQVLMTDATGGVALADLPAGLWSIHAHRPGEYGEEEVSIPVPGSPSELTLRQRRRFWQRQLGLDRVRMFHVWVRDAAGEPLPDVIVVLLDPDSGDSPPAPLEETNLHQVIHATSGADGRAVFALSTRGLGRATRLEAAVLRHGDALVRETRRVDKSRSMTLILPPTVTLRLRVASDGKSLPANVLFRAGSSFRTGGMRLIYWADEATFANTLDGLVSSWCVNVPVEGRSVRAFAPGTQLTFVTRVSHHAESFTTITLTDEPEQELTLSPGRERAKLEFRLVEESGNPRKSSNLVFEFNGKGVQERLRAVAESLPGHGVVHSLRISPGVGGKLEILHYRPKWSSTAIAWPSRTIEVPSLGPGEARDLGVLRLPRLPILVAGRVVDHVGQPREGVKVKVDLMTFGSNSPPERTDYSLTSTSDRDGFFEIRAPAANSGNYTLIAFGGDRSTRVPFPPGAVDLELEARPISRIRGRVRCARPELKDQLDLVLLRDETKVTGLYFDTQPDGSFTAGERYGGKELLPGEYQLRVLVAGMVVAEIDEIIVRAGEVSQPDELVNRIVGEDILYGEVSVRNPEGEPVCGCLVLVASLSEGEVPTFDIFGRRSETDFEGVARVIYRRGEKIQIAVDPFLSLQPDNLLQKTIRSPVFPLEVELSSSRKHE